MGYYTYKKAYDQMIVESNTKNETLKKLINLGISTSMADARRVLNSMTKEKLEKLISDKEEKISEDGAPVGAMSSGPNVDASVNDPNDPNATYVPAKNKKKQCEGEVGKKCKGGNNTPPIEKRDALKGIQKPVEV